MPTGSRAARAKTPISATGANERSGAVGSLFADGVRVNRIAGHASDGARAAARGRGFTLIELLVVIAIVGIVVAAVTLSLRGSGVREVENAARRAEALVALACERAVIGGRDIGFSPVADGLRFGYFERDGWQPLSPSPNDELRPRALGNGIVLRAERDGEVLELEQDAPDEPAFACFASGEMTPFVLELSRADAPQPWRLTGTLDGRLALREGDDDGRR